MGLRPIEALEDSIMLLYHYATKRLNILKTRRKQGSVTPADIMRANKSKHIQIKPYYDHISFFFEPLPAKHMGFFFKDVNHSIWKDRTVVYEHVVDTDTFDFQYEIVETEADYKQMMTEWPKGRVTQAQRSAYLLRQLQRKLRTDEAGRSKDYFERNARPHVGQLLQDFIRAQSRYEYIEERLKHAALVPHAMIYPADGVIALTTTPRRVVIQSVPVKLSLEDNRATLITRT